MAPHDISPDANLAPAVAGHVLCQRGGDCARALPGRRLGNHGYGRGSAEELQRSTLASMAQVFGKVVTVDETIKQFTAALD